MKSDHRSGLRHLSAQFCGQFLAGWQKATEKRNFRRGGGPHSQRKGDVFPNRLMRIECVRLENHRNIALRRAERCHLASSDHDVSVGRIKKPCNDSEQSGFPAARGAQQADELSFLHGEIDFLKYLHRIVGFCYALEFKRCSHAATSRSELANQRGRRLVATA